MIKYIKYLKYVLFTIPISVFWILPKNVISQDVPLFNISTFTFSEDSVSVNLNKYKYKDTYVIKDTIDLQGKTWYLPRNLSIKIDGGIIRNGVLAGNNTTLDVVGCAFDSVHICGRWRVADINTSMFSNLAYENSLKDVFALTNSDVNNRITVERGDYYLRAIGNYDECLKIGSNTHVIIDGNIRLCPNNYTNYSILHLAGNNITISGTGCVIGDKPTHTGTKGEWGMGVDIFGGENVTIRGLNIKDCWGDCIYISGNAKKVLIESCNLDNGRRQGVSVCSADSVYIKNCIITNVGGTPPERAIDVEPNDGEKVNFVHIDNVQIEHCVGGIMSYREQNSAIVNTLIISNCSIYHTEKVPMSFTRTNNVIVKGNKIVNYQYKNAFNIRDVDLITISNNTINDKRLRNNKEGYSNLNITGKTRVIIK